MALTVTQTGRRTVFGDRRVHFFDIAFDTSYPTGGESLTAADLGLSRVDLVLCEPASAAAGATAVVVKYDRTNSKLQAYGQQPTSATTTVIPLDEVDSTEDLSALLVRVMAVGI